MIIQLVCYVAIYANERRRRREISDGRAQKAIERSFE